MQFAGAIGQLDTEFWFVAPEVWDGHGDVPFCCAFQRWESLPKSRWNSPPIRLSPFKPSTSANGTQTLDLTPWLGDIENKPVNTVLEGLRITSDAPVTAYYEINHLTIQTFLH